MIFNLTKRKGRGGGYTIDDILASDVISGDLIYTGTTIRKGALGSLTSPFTFSAPNVTDLLADSLFTSSTGLTALSIPNIQRIGANACQGCSSLEYVVAPKCGTLYSTAFSSCSNIKAVDLGGDPTGAGLFRNSIFQSCTKLKTVVLRSANMWPLANIGVFALTPFASGGTGGTIYIPKSLYDHLGDGTANDYKAATNWSTVDGYGTITWKSIESTHTDPNAPIDLTLYYADGTPIPTE